MIYLVLVFSLLAGSVYWLCMSPYSQAIGEFPYRSTTSEKIVALTFDDGPNEPYTSELLEYLDSKNIKVTFFQVGKNVEIYPEVSRLIYKSGHTIGIHSLSHSFLKYFTHPYFRTEIQLTIEIIENVIGRRPRLFRPPWLFRQPLLMRTLKNMNLQPVSGTFGSSLEVFGASSQNIAKSCLKSVAPGSIVIFHDGYNAKGANRSRTIGAVKIVVEILESKGYSFVTVDELLGVEAYQ